MVRNELTQLIALYLRNSTLAEPGQIDQLSQSPKRQVSKETSAGARTVAEGDECALANRRLSEVLD